MKKMTVLVVFLGFGATLLSGLPVVKRLMHTVTIQSRVTPVAAGPFATRWSTSRFETGPRDQQPAASFPVDVWFPADVQACATSLPCSGASADQLDKVAISPKGPFPLLVYAPGWNGPRSDNRFLLRGLSSHGYIVMAVDDVGQDPVPDPAVIPGDFDLSSCEALHTSQAIAASRLAAMVRRVTSLLDQLGDPTTAVGRTFGPAIDMTRIGFVGFSFGGSVAAEAALTERRLRAIANMDGWLFGHAAQRGVPGPYLVFNSDYSALPADAASQAAHRRLTAQITIEDRRQQIRLVASGNTTALLFPGTRHDDFTDSLFAPSLITYLRQWQRTDEDRLKLQQSIEGHLLAFFDRHLKASPQAAEQSRRIEALWPVTSLPAPSPQPMVRS